MRQTNCHNCGAALDWTKSVCSYCETYFRSPGELHDSLISAPICQQTDARRKAETFDRLQLIATLGGLVILRGIGGRM
jgi:predicted amidophosphoribosyltransferase